MTQKLTLQSAVKLFMETAGDKVNKFDSRQITLYTGLQLEEMAEKLEVIRDGAISQDSRDDFDVIIPLLRNLSKRFKQGLHLGDVLRCNHEDMLREDLDLAWVSLGSAFSASIDTEGAIAELIRANLAKFPNGQAIRDENGKIQKPAGWQPPQFQRFVAPRPV